MSVASASTCSAIIPVAQRYVLIAHERRGVIVYCWGLRSTTFPNFAQPFQASCAYSVLLILVHGSTPWYHSPVSDLYRRRDLVIPIPFARMIARASLVVAG